MVGLISSWLTICMQGLWEGGSSGTSVRDPENQEEVCESLNLHNLSHRRFIFIFTFYWSIFNYF